MDIPQHLIALSSIVYYYFVLVSIIKKEKLITVSRVPNEDLELKEFSASQSLGLRKLVKTSNGNKKLAMATLSIGIINSFYGYLDQGARPGSRR